MKKGDIRKQTGYSMTKSLNRQYFTDIKAVHDIMLWVVIFLGPVLKIFKLCLHICCIFMYT